MLKTAVIAGLIPQMRPPGANLSIFKMLQQWAYLKIVKKIIVNVLLAVIPTMWTCLLKVDHASLSV